MTTIKKSMWQRSESCPVCGQGPSLTFYIRPACAGILPVCAEEGSVFVNSRTLESSSIRSIDRCLFCTGATLEDFVPATWEQLRDAGFAQADV